VKPKGDKVSRALAVQPLLAKELIYAPAKDWADTVITQCSLFPHGRHDDLVDSATQMLWWLRETSVLRLDEEVKADAVERVTYRHGSRPRAIYPC
jgi:phage terminase large subunit-like protein